jgi:hypothetical protein
MTLFVVYGTETGHVLGAIGSTGAPPLPPPDPSNLVPAGSLVGTVLPLRVSLGAGQPAVVSVRATDLAAHAPDDEPDVLTEPLAFGVEQVAGQQPKPALKPLLPWADGLEFRDGGLSVTLPPPPPDQVNVTHVVAYVTDGQDTRRFSGDIGAGGSTVVLPVAAEVGPHGVLVLVTGYAARLEAVTK